MRTKEIHANMLLYPVKPLLNTLLFFAQCKLSNFDCSAFMYSLLIPCTKDDLIIFFRKHHQMAQVCFERSNLRKALRFVPRHAVGARNVADVLRITLEDRLPNSFSIFANTIATYFINGFSQDIQNKCLKYLMKCFNTHPPFQFEEALLSGSWSEGLSMYQVASDTPKLSDMNFMCILKSISFSEEDQARDNLTVYEDTPFVNAYIMTPELLKMWENFLEDSAEEDTTRRQLSSRKLKAMLYENDKKIGNVFDRASARCKTIGDGPSLELKMELQDFDLNEFAESLVNVMLYKMMASSEIILCIRCDGWPRCALEWLSRDRLWPNKNLVEKICQEGFHIVPKSSPEGNFRLSFSNAETTLIENLTPLQHQVIRAFKAVIKYHQSNWSSDIKDIICTYHLKTIAFWHVEKTTQDSWTEDNFDSHLLSLIEEFAEALSKRNLPMYFLPKYNLLENAQNVEEMKKIPNKVAELSKNIPAITTAVIRAANANRSYFILSDTLCAWGGYMNRHLPFLKVENVQDGMRDEKEAKTGSENKLGIKDESTVQDDWSLKKKLEIRFQEFDELVRKLEWKEVMIDKSASLMNIANNLYCCIKQLEREHETFITLD